MEAQASLGLWEILLWIFTGSSLLGLPPGDRDPGLIKSVPAQTLVYFEWAARGAGTEGATGVDGFAADPEIRQFFESLSAFLEKREQIDDEDPLLELRAELPQLMKLISAHPGCLFVGFDPKPAAKQGLANWLNMLAGIHGGVILNGGEDADALWQSINRSLKCLPDFEFDEKRQTNSIPIPVPGYKLVEHREGSRIIFAFGDGTLPRVVEGLSGQQTGLEKNPRFRQAMDRVAVNRISTLAWIDSRGIASAATSALGPLGLVARPIMAIVGIDSLDSVAQVSGIDDNTMIQRTSIATGGKTEGMLVIASGQPILAQHLAHIPADADLVIATSICQKNVFEEVRRMLATTQPFAIRIFDEAVKQLEAELELKFADDVFPAFGDVITAFDSPAEGGIVATSLVFSLEVRDHHKAETVFDRVMKLIDESLSADHAEMEFGAQATLRSQKFLDHTIYYVHSSGAGFGAHSVITPTFCLTGKHWLIAIHPQAMKAQLRHLKSAQTGFDRVYQKLTFPDGDVLSYAYLNGPRANGFMAAVLPYLAQTWANDDGPEEKVLDCFSIPSAVAISPYFGDSSAAVIRQKEGLLIEMKNAPPVIVSVAMISAYRTWHSMQTEFFDGRLGKLNGAQQAQLGAIDGPVGSVTEESKVAANDRGKLKITSFQKWAPIFAKAFIPDDIQNWIPESAFRTLEESPPKEAAPTKTAAERHEEARRKRLERRARILK